MFRVLEADEFPKSEHQYTTITLTPDSLNLITVEPRYNEVARYRKKCSLYRGLRYSEDPVITNYLVKSKNIRYSGVTKLDQARSPSLTKLNNGIYTTQQSTDLRVNNYI